MAETGMLAQQTGTSVNLQELAGRLSEGALSCDPGVIEAHAKDEALFCPAEGAIALVRARGVSDVQETLRFAHQHQIPVVPQGARTGISGGANAVAGSILLNVASMNRILEVNQSERTVRAEPGVINQELKNYVAQFGLAYPPDPGSVAISSIGGNIATNAGGLCCVKYGVTRDYVLSMKVVLADGTLAHLGTDTAKGVAGLDLRGLFIGSEGTLGVLVEATLRLVPALGEPLTAIAIFADERSGLAAVADYMAAGATPRMLEFLDGQTLTMLNDFGGFGLDESAGGMLLMQADPVPGQAEAIMSVFTTAAERNGAIEVAYSEDPADSEALVMARRMAQPAYEKYAQEHGGGQLLDDVCLPRAAMAEFYDRVAKLRDESRLMITVVAHAGDGNTHPSVFFDASDPQQTTEAERVFTQIMEIGLTLGGTITGEHGVGYLKREWLARELDEGTKHLHRAIKAAVDPLGILNPEKMLSAV